MSASRSSILVVCSSRDQVTLLIDKALGTPSSQKHHVVASYATILDKYSNKSYVGQLYAAKDVKTKRSFGPEDPLILDQLVGKDVYGIDWIKASLEKSRSLCVGATAGTSYNDWTPEWVKAYFARVVIGPGTTSEAYKLAQLLGWQEVDLRKHLSKDKYLTFQRSSIAPITYTLVSSDVLTTPSQSAALVQDSVMEPLVSEVKMSSPLVDIPKGALPKIPQPPVPRQVVIKTETLASSQPNLSQFYEVLWFNAVLCPNVTEEQWDAVWEKTMVESELISKMWANADVQYNSTSPHGNRRFVSCIYASISHSHLLISLLLNQVREWVDKGLIEEGGFFIRK